MIVVPYCVLNDYVFLLIFFIYSVLIFIFHLPVWDIDTNVRFKAGGEQQSIHTVSTRGRLCLAWSIVSDSRRPRKKGRARPMKAVTQAWVI
ncbi:hypothetical protein SGGMMB4_03126 [Sodalis glossinidius str. 'morsitans']|uniref:Uncharacterized protein n=1 Tax=Sodalis glossinidius (strain morsitans) TaxID=343509 RepID=A0A193QJQ2_SODGM|nr:hypothetical protein [Sodalis glossinidius]CRL45419.1 hypothetical protein SGGMMB4_03126 [Sodalis glossinidius str. 'morsitans']